jgi:hypothetical protein
MSRIWKLLASPTAIHIAIAVLGVIVEALSRKASASEPQW